MPQTNIRGAQILNNTVQRQDLDTSTVGQALVTKIVQGAGITLSSTGADSGTGDVTVSGVSAVSTDAGNQSKLGSDSLIYTPGGINGFVSKTAAYTLTQADRNKYFICSGGSWTLTLPAAAAGLSYNVRNDMGISGTTGTITLQPAAGTIDGLASIPLLPQQECVIVCDGTNWRTFGLKREVILGTQDITTSTAQGVVLLPVGYRYFELTFTGFCPVGAATVLDYLAGQFSSNGGSTWITANYYTGLITNSSATTVIFLDQESTASFWISPNNQGTTAAGISKLTVFPGSAGAFPEFIVDAVGRTGSNGQQKGNVGGAYYGAAVVINALKYFCGSGNNILNCFLTVKGVV